MALNDGLQTFTIRSYQMFQGNATISHFSQGQMFEVFEFLEMFEVLAKFQMLR